MTRSKKPTFDPETIDPASLVDFRVVRPVGTGFEVELMTPVPMSDAIEIGQAIALVRARCDGWPEIEAIRLAERVATYMARCIEMHLDDLDHNKWLDRALPIPDRFAGVDDDIPF